MATPISTKSPRENYATRLDEAKPNIGHPGSTQERTADADRAAAELADRETGTPSVTSPFPAAR